MLATAAVGLGAGCYATTPHRGEAASNAGARSCAEAVIEVFSDSGFAALAAPPDLSMLYEPRASGSRGASMSAGAAVAVKIGAPAGAAGSCHVTLEAVSPDVDCPAPQSSMFSEPRCQARNVSQPAPPIASGEYLVPECPARPVVACKLSYAPGAQNDAVVDELARRLQSALGPTGSVD